MNVTNLFLATLLLSTTAAVSCGGDKDDDKTVVLSKQSIEIFAKEEYKLTFSGVPDVLWTTDQDFVATVFGGVVRGEHVGKTTIRATYRNSVATCEVTVKPTMDVLPKPILQFGATPEQIKALEPGAYVKGAQVTGYYYDEYDRGGRKLEYRFIDNLLVSVVQIEHGMSFEDGVKILQERFKYISPQAHGYLYYHPIDDYYMIAYLNNGCIFGYWPEP